MPLTAGDPLDLEGFQVHFSIGK